ncbi:hypothetical protein [Streptomyces clavuligerus]|uniref:hypothetical protein n=1 Tax=Streptomyces clavuligerus TaxID=1901 RepID=UPI00020D944A|nr:hypothetical protein [Streptomyces clavuligerus]ANW19375.1 hypothetical protein BB341_14680 [Streptomyces clavuligerus]AXU13978.1 hypothetical protein D1794_15300 [Streptomyces clavuligerus]MBY6303953.1 hypothetical protein [Streptomyces clavuligerus]QCS06752.1 hypothetical protein CRV15_14655 [Streptomyces clavuligerus]QPJ93897.1 hypothetical protein GE265_13365 [Streptomyces clavuligerus]
MRRTRRITTALGSLAAACAMTFALATPATAANGWLIVSGEKIENPSGCYSGRYWPLVVNNQTDGYALVYDGPNCTGRVIEVVPPGGMATSELGRSVSIN